jgi:hypothetical protein
VWHNKANSGQRRNYRGNGVAFSPKAVPIDCPLCSGGALVLPGTPDATCCNCGANIHITWKESNAKEEESKEA